MTETPDETDETLYATEFFSQPRLPGRYRPSPTTRISTRNRQARLPR